MVTRLAAARVRLGLHQHLFRQPLQEANMSNALMNIQIIPKAYDVDDVYPAVEAAIALVEQSEMSYEVGALGTTVQGDIDGLLELAKAMNKVIVERGCKSVISQIRVYLGNEPITMDGLTDKFRH